MRVSAALFPVTLIGLTAYHAGTTGLPDSRTGSAQERTRHVATIRTSHGRRGDAYRRRCACADGSIGVVSLLGMRTLLLHGVPTLRLLSKVSLLSLAAALRSLWLAAILRGVLPALLGLAAALVVTTDGLRCCETEAPARVPGFLLKVGNSDGRVCAKAIAIPAGHGSAVSVRSVR